MSRSFRHTPKSAITCAVSEKFDKQRAHRQARAFLRSTGNAPHAKQFGDPWTCAKDGKTYFDAAKWPESMRK